MQSDSSAHNIAGSQGIMPMEVKPKERLPTLLMLLHRRTGNAVVGTVKVGDDDVNELHVKKTLEGNAG